MSAIVHRAISPLFVQEKDPLDPPPFPLPFPILNAAVLYFDFLFVLFVNRSVVCFVLFYTE